jgi:hypothetical protein
MQSQGVQEAASGRYKQYTVEQLGQEIKYLEGTLAKLNDDEEHRGMKKDLTARVEAVRAELERKARVEK